MADIITTLSSYSTGTNDTASTLVNNVSATDAIQPNGIASAAVQIEATLGVATTLKGSQADLVARLAVAINADGTIKLGTDAALSGILSELHGGTGLTAVPNACYKGPQSIGSGSTQIHEGDVTISGNTNLSGVHFYTNFTLNNAVTVTVPAQNRSLVIVAYGTITINGTITATGAGPVGGAGGAGRGGDGSTPGDPGVTADDGTDQPGSTGGTGGSGSTGGGSGAVGGRVLLHGIVLASGGSSQVSGALGIRHSLYPATVLGSAGGGGGGGGGGQSGQGDGAAGGAGGAGGGTIVLIAPTIVLASTAVLTTSGADGSAGGSVGGIGRGGGGGGAGGSAGNLFMITHTYTNNGVTFNLAGGAGGAAGSSSLGTATAGATGIAGIRQILVF